MARGLLVLFAALAVCGTNHAADNRPVGGKADWPQWRGPERQNRSTDTGLLKRWPAAGPRLLWKAKGLGKGFSSVAIADGRIFTLGDRARGQFVVALSLDGKELWSTRISDLWSPGDYAGPRSTPTADGETVYVIGPHGDLVSLSVADGRINWRRNLQDEFKGQVQGRWGYSESPLIDGDRLICTPGGPDAGMVALDKKTGREIWRVAIPELGPNGAEGAAYSSIVKSNGAGVPQYVQFVGYGVVGVSTEGKYLWGYNKIANRTAAIPTPLVNGDYVFASSGYQAGAALLKLEKTARGVTAREVYFLDARTFQNHHGGMVMVGDFVYAGHGHKAGAPTCLNWKTGKVVWRNNRGPGTGSSAVTYADGSIYFRFEDGTMALVTASPTKYEEKSTFQIPNVEQPSWPQPVVIGGRLYLREQEELLCYDVKE